MSIRGVRSHIASVDKKVELVRALADGRICGVLVDIYMVFAPFRARAKFLRQQMAAMR